MSRVLLTDFFFFFLKKGKQPTGLSKLVPADQLASQSIVLVRSRDIVVVCLQWVKQSIIDKRVLNIDENGIDVAMFVHTRRTKPHSAKKKKKLRQSA